MKADTQGVMRKGKNDRPIAKARHRAVVISETTTSVIILVPDWPTV